MKRKSVELRAWKELIDGSKTAHGIKKAGSDKIDIIAVDFIG